MVPGEAPESTQCPSLTSLNTRDVARRRHKRRSRQHQRFMVRKALLQEQELLSMASGSGPCPLSSTSQTPGGTEASGSRRQRLKAKSGSGSGLRSKRPVLREAPRPGPSKYVAIDCEMVGTGPRGRVSELARCSVVSYSGDVLYDKYVRPEMPIVDYRTRWSGITRQHMHKAIPFQVAQKEVRTLGSCLVCVTGWGEKSWFELPSCHWRVRGLETPLHFSKHAVPFPKDELIQMQVLPLCRLPSCCMRAACRNVM